MNVRARMLAALACRRTSAGLGLLGVLRHANARHPSAQRAKKRHAKAQHPSPARGHREARIRNNRAAITAATALTSAVPSVIPTRRMSPVTAFCGLNVVNTIVTVSTVA